MNKLIMEFYLRVFKALTMFATFWFFFWAVIWQAIWFQLPFPEWQHPSDMINTLGFLGSFMAWMMLEMVFAHPEILRQITLPKWLRRAQVKTTEKKAKEEDDRQPVY